MTPLRRAGRRWAKSPSAAARSAASSLRRTSSWSPVVSRPFDLDPDVRPTAAVLLIMSPLTEPSPPDAPCAFRASPGGTLCGESLLAAEGTAKRGVRHAHRTKVGAPAAPCAQAGAG